MLFCLYLDITISEGQFNACPFVCLLVCLLLFPFFFLSFLKTCCEGRESPSFVVLELFIIYAYILELLLQERGVHSRWMF